MTINVSTRFQVLLSDEEIDGTSIRIGSTVGTFIADIDGRTWEMSFIVDEDYNDIPPIQRAAKALQLLTKKVCEVSGCAKEP